MIYLNLGRREVGKTTLASYLISKSATRIIFDPRGLFPAPRRLTNTDAIGAAMETLDARQPRDGELVITPDTDVQGCFDQACYEVKNWLKSGRADIAFLVDELRFIPDKDGPDLNWILRCATRDSVAVVFTAHRPVDVSTDIRAISDVWCIFQMTQENDLRVIAERCSPAVAQHVAKLPPRHFIAWNDAIGKMTIHTHPDRWFVPLRASAALTDQQQPIDTLDGADLPASRGGRFDFSA